MICGNCGYDWKPRKSSPKACPRCKYRLDYPKKRMEDPLSDSLEVERGFKRTAHVMSIITSRLEKEDIVPVIVGGSAVEFYTRDWYATSDIDLAIDKAKREGFRKVMEEMGFKKDGRMFAREDLGLYIEIPADIQDISMENLTRLDLENGHVYFIGIEDLIIDRIQAAEHWKSDADLEQAKRIAASFYEDVDWDLIRMLCREESSEKMLDKLLKEVKG